MKNKITKKTLLGDIMVSYPKAAKKLTKDYGLHCMGCSMAQMESLEDGLKVHGMDAKEIKKVVDELNKITD